MSEEAFNRQQQARQRRLGANNLSSTGSLPLLTTRNNAAFDDIKASSSINRSRSSGFVAAVMGSLRSKELTEVVVPRSDREDASKPGERHGLFLAHVLRQTTLDLLAVIVCIIVAFGTDKAAPRSAYVIKSYMLENNSYPHKGNTVPSWTVPIYAILGPIVCFVAYKFVFRRPAGEVFRLSLNFLLAVFLTAAVTNAIKAPIGRLRPNFASVCWPDGATQVFKGPNTANGGYPVCSPDVTEADHNEIRKSFPSGHSSWSAAGLGYFTYFLLGQLQAYAGDGYGWRFLVSILPGLGAVAVGITRIVDYWHHPTDVIFGLLLGFLISYVLYRQFYPSLTHPNCDVPLYVLKRRAVYAAAATGEREATSGVGPSNGDALEGQEMRPVLDS